MDWPRKLKSRAQLRASSAARTASATAATVSSSVPFFSSATAMALALTVAEKTWASLSLLPTEAEPRSASKIIAVRSATQRASVSSFLPRGGLTAVGGASLACRVQDGGGAVG